ncbi:2-nitropropane dioxygenase [Ephemerocybe angulata]|nr:2-nitropropane dioxygenase [Tulosesus angulatus]
MAFGSGGKLAAEVSRAGGFGFMGLAFETPDQVKQELATARSILDVPADSTLPIGVGYIGWILDESEPKAKELISIAFEHRVRAIWLSHGDNLGKWVGYYRELVEKTGHHPLLAVQVSFPETAQVAIDDWKADIIVAQGIEAGGHGAAEGFPLLTLLPLILSKAGPNGPPIIAAGGIATGSQVAALLTLGASGAALGTRFLLSPESLYSDKQRQVILDAESPQSVRTLAFDEARGYHNWPKYVDGRAIRNATYDDFQKGDDINVIRQKYAAASETEDLDRVVVWAGAGVSAMNKVLPAKDIVQELHEECLSHLRGVNGLVKS